MARPGLVLRGEERLYFEHARERELVFQACEDCESRIFYPRTVCPNCMGVNLTLRRSSGRGAVHSHTTQYRPGHPAFADVVPYTIVLVDLDDGVRVLADLVDCGPADVAIGMGVEVLFADVDEQLTLPRFRPIGREDR